MESYTHHRSRSRAAAGAPRPPPTSKKPYANRNGFTAYDDVFGGPPKFGTAPPFAPRAEDYMEIFGSFLSSRASSIPILDLPPVDDSVADFAGAGCDYTDVFGGLKFAEFAVPYNELFKRSDGGDNSSDEAWTSTESEESDPSAISERNQCFINGDFHQPVESQQFNVSYHQVNTGTMEDSSFTRVAQVSAVPGYTYMVRGSTSLENEGGESGSSGITDDIILREDPSGNISFETLSKNSKKPFHDFSANQFYEPDDRTGRAGVSDNYFVDPTVEHISYIDARSKSSELWEQSGPPHMLFGSLEASVSRSDLRNGAYEKNAESGSLPVYDVEVDASPSGLACVESMKEAMQRAELKLKCAKESMERKKDGHNGAKPSLKNETSDRVKVRVPSEESGMEMDAFQSKSHSDHKEIRNKVKGVSDSSTSVHPFRDFVQAEQASGATVKPSQKNVMQDHSPSSLDSDSVGGEDDWKEASQYFDLVNNGNFKTEPKLLDNSNRVEHELNSHHNVNERGKYMADEQQDIDGTVVGSSSSSGGDDDSDRFEDAQEPREILPRLRAVKATSRQDFHQKMVKVAQEFHEKVTTNDVYPENEVKKGGTSSGSDEKTETCLQVNEQRNEDTAEKLGFQKKHVEEAPSKVRTTIESNETKLAEHVEEGKEVIKGGKEESRMKEEYTWEENAESMKACASVNENGRAVKEALQSDLRKDYSAPKGKGRKEQACPTNENDIGDDNTFELKEDRTNVGRSKLQLRSWKLEDGDSKSREMDKEVLAGKLTSQPIEILRMEQQEEIIKEDAVASCCYETVKGSFEHEEPKKHEAPLVYDITAEGKISDVAQKSSKNNLESLKLEKESVIPTNSSDRKKNRKVRGNADNNSGKQEGCKNHVESGLQRDVLEPRKVSDNVDKDMEQQAGCQNLQSDVLEPDGLSRTTIHVEMEQFASVNEPSSTNGRKSQMACGSEESGSSSSSNMEANGEINSNVAHRCEEQTSSVASQKACENEDISDCKTQPSVAEDEVKPAEMVDKPVSKENVRKQKVAQPVMTERKEPIQSKSQPTTATRRFRQEGTASSGNLAREESGRSERLKRERDLEEERIRKVEEEREREREREKDRMGDIAFADAEACGRVDRTSSLDKATAEARQRAMAEARERLEKACAEARGKSSSDKSLSAAEAARLNAQRAAVERATAEARERAAEKAKVDRERFGRSVSDNITTRYSSLSSSSDFDGVEGETAERCKARLERHRRTVERVAKALAEKNLRDLIAQKEQAERNRFAETLDADIKRWSNGKEGNLRALLSTLQYILGPDSGWQPIPLTEVITSAAVKKAYRKATLCVHPDKLQQRGATIQQKYLCEKVFDLLKDGWSKFNSEER